MVEPGQLRVDDLSVCGRLASMWESLIYVEQERWDMALEYYSGLTPVVHLLPRKDHGVLLCERLALLVEQGAGIPTSASKPWEEQSTTHGSRSPPCDRRC